MPTLKSSLPVVSIEEAVERQLCVGCGACASLEPERFEMFDALDWGRRPRVRSGAAPTNDLGLTSCPGVQLGHTFDAADPAYQKELVAGWGPVLEVWEGYAGDPDIRFAGSSGGAATALALHCIEHEGMAGVLHTAGRADVPYLNETVFSRSREELLSRAGSRYAPASPCDSLAWVENEERASVFIGKPCDVAAVQNARKVRPELDRKLGLTIGFFCAGTPSTRGTLELLKKAGVEDPATIQSLRYRGKGWPGLWTVEWTDAQGQQHQSQMTYDESWGFLQRFRQWRCYICPDHTGEFADIAVGDPWYRKVEPGEPGKSLIVARTQRGLEILRRAAAKGSLVLETKSHDLLPASQPNLLQTRGALWGRLLALRMMGAPVPFFDGFAMYRFWKKLPFKAKLQSFTGTLKRIQKKKLRKRVAVR